MSNINKSLNNKFGSGTGKEPSVFERAVDMVAGNAIEGVANRRVNALLGGKIIDNGEFDSLADIRNATIDYADWLEPYKIVHSIFGSDLKTDVLNNKSIRDKEIDFFVKYLSGSSVDTMFNSIADKVVSAATRIVAKDQEIGTDTDKLKKIDNGLATFGRIGMYVTSFGDNIEDFSYDVLEPYRYIVREDMRIIITKTRPHKVRNKLHQAFEIIEMSKDQEGVWTQTKYMSYIDMDRKGNYVLAKFGDVESIEEVQLPHAALYEIRNVHQKSDLSQIKQQILEIDMVETLMAMEAKQAQFSIHADQAYFEDGGVLKQDVYKILNSGYEDKDRPMYDAFQPEMRVDQYVTLIDHLIQKVSQTLGVSTRALGIPNVSATKQVATIAVLDEEKTAETINSRKSSLQRQFTHILRIFYPEYTLVLPDYVSQSMAAKSEILKTMEKTMSTEQKVKFLHPAWGEDEQEKETILIKIENKIPMTKSEEELARDLDLI